MRVMMLTWEYPPRSVGGLAEHVHHLSTSLAHRGVDVAVVTAGMPDSPPVSIENGVSVYRIALPGPTCPGLLPWVLSLNLELLSTAASVLMPAVCARDWRARLERRRRPVIIHAHDWLVMFAARSLKRMFRLPLVSTIHATEAGRQGGLHTAEQRFINDVEWTLTYESWRVVCCSRFMAREVAGQLAVPTDKVRVIPNGVDSAGLTTASEPGNARRYVGDNQRLVLFIGRLVPEKGVQHLISAAPRILRRHPDTRFVIAGTGPYRSDLEQLARTTGMSDAVVFAGYVDDDMRRSLYARADVAVFPSIYEPFGIVALEAMASSTPVVVSEVGGFAETVSDGVDGLLAAPGSAVALAEAVCRILGSPHLSTRLVAGGRRTAAAHSWDEVAAGTMDVYHEAHVDRDLGRWRRGLCPAGNGTKLTRQEGIVR